MTGPVLAAIVVAVVCPCPGAPATQGAPSSTVAATAAAARPLSDADRQALGARAREWWIAREHRDHQRMYDLFEPAYRKQVVFADFLKESAVRTRFDLTDTRVDAVTADAADRARVRVNMETRPPGLPRGRVTAEDIWVRVSGKWFKVHQAVPLPFTTSR